MATPATVRQRDNAIEKAKKKKELQSRLEQQQQSYSYQQPSISYANKLAPQKPSASGTANFAEDADVKNFDYDEWKTSAPATSTPAVAPPLQQEEIYSKTLTVNKDDVYFFHGKEDFLSTFYDAPYILQGHIYPDVETYYEACKLYCLVNSDAACALQTLKGAAQCKKVASQVLRDHGVQRRMINQWKRGQGAQAIYHGTYQKITEHAELKQKLLDTGDKFIVHCYDKDNIYSSGCTKEELEKWFEQHHGKVIDIPVSIHADFNKVTRVGNGLNMLGYICMAIRDELRRYDTNAAALENLSLA